MGSSDNLMAGLAGFSEAGSNVLNKLIDYKLRQSGRQQDYLNELNAYKTKLSLEEPSKIRVSNATRPTTYVEGSDGSVTPYPGSFSRTPVVKTDKTPRKIITSQQAQQLRDAGVDVNDQTYTIHDVPGAQTQSTKEGDAKWAIAEIDRILPLNEGASGGLFGAMRQKGMSALNIEDQKFRNTADVVNSARSLVARVLKSTFGGQLSDAEREYLNSVYGAMPNYSVAERRIALTNVKRMMIDKAGLSGTSQTPTLTSLGGLDSKIQGQLPGGAKIKSIKRID